MGLGFHVYTVNKSGHTRKSLETYLMILVVRWGNYHYLSIRLDFIDKNKTQPSKDYNDY